MIKQNEHIIDRLLRILLAVLFFVIGYFWMFGILQIVFYILGILMLATGVIGFCGLYTLIGVNTKKSFLPSSKIVSIIFGIFIIIVLLAGSYASNFFSKKIFLEDFNLMNNNYKQTLFYTGQGNRQESIVNYDKLLETYFAFEIKYKQFQPVAIRDDKMFINDLNKIEAIITNLEENIRTASLQDAHLKLEEIRTLWQDIFKRNDFSMLAIALVDFHDSMEKMIDPSVMQDLQMAAQVYAETDEKLKTIEAELNDEEIKEIRNNLDKLLEMIQSNANLDDLDKQGSLLKSSYVKVYLKRG